MSLILCVVAFKINTLLFLGIFFMINPGILNCLCMCLSTTYVLRPHPPNPRNPENMVIKKKISYRQKPGPHGSPGIKDNTMQVT